MNERAVTMQQLRLHAAAAKHEVGAVLDILGWPHDEALSCAIDRLIELREQAVKTL
jgi:hypothetical protein